MDIITRPKIDNEPILVPISAEIRASITRDRPVRFLNGRFYKLLKRHLAANGMTPEQYRDHYKLPWDYPMVSPAYDAVRSRIAGQIWLARDEA